MVADLLIGLVTSFGYLGVFASSLIGSATIILPVPSFFIVIFAGTVLNPVAVGIIGGLGGAIGEMTGYLAGYGGRMLADKKSKKPKKWLRNVEELFKKYGGMPVIFIFAATPLPDDIIGIFCGAIKYSPKKFFIATLAGKIVLYIFLAYAGFYGWDFVSKYLTTGSS
ncbi:MAG: VTT domain-containing protein [Candidatus Aenigmarchaeota archaeon]|nr:VTT domain-containing protein [Candidatus Aenigmarchaeota archaeon]